jgi:hypothetical protein
VAKIDKGRMLATDRCTDAVHSVQCSYGVSKMKEVVQSLHILEQKNQHQNQHVNLSQMCGKVYEDIQPG